MPKLSKKAIFIKKYEAVLAIQVRKAYIHFCLDDEDSFEDEIDNSMVAELASRVHTDNGIAIGNACSIMASI